MKSFIIGLILILNLSYSQAGNADLFKIDNQKVSEMMTDLSTLEKQIASNYFVSHDEIATNYPNVIMAYEQSPYLESTLFIHQQMNGQNGCAVVIAITCCTMIGISLGYYFLSNTI